MQDAELLIFTDKNIVVTFPNSVDDLFHELQKESEKTIEWFSSNKIKGNSNKFQFIIIKSLL